jgi:hypothetical protein
MTRPFTASPHPEGALLPQTAAKFVNLSDTARELLDQYEEVISLPGVVGGNTFGTGTPAVAQIAATGLAAWHLDADNEEVVVPVRIPRCADLDAEILCCCLCSNAEAAGTGGYTMTPLYNGALCRVPGDGRTAAAPVKPATAFDYSPDKQTDLNTDEALYTDFAVINAETAAIQALRAGVDRLDILWKVTRDTVAHVDVLSVHTFFRRLMA